MSPRGTMHGGGHDAPLSYHGRLLLDPHRMDAYERAIRALVRPGDVVLDAGTGSGVLAMLAARRGARVHAVESMPIAGLARALVEHNGLADRVTVQQADLLGLAPVEPVDLIVSEFLGAFLVDDRMLPAIAAAGRWLRPGGRWCPSRVRLWLAPADVGVREVEVWQAPFYGVDLSPALAPALAEAHRLDVGPGVLLAEGAPFHDFVPPGPLGRCAHALAFTAARDGRLRGFVGWFEAELAPGVTLSTAPGVQTHWGQYLFPVAAVDVAAGDRLEVELALDDGDALVWRWSGAVRRGGEVRATFALADDGRWSTP
ncbi:MAG TPA: methyltransferase domain-containing protein [Kofleriaceae bacterium]|nr:methyltransferase domain-containing protein [Kofleriaceae bacterium]